MMSHARRFCMTLLVVAATGSIAQVPVKSAVATATAEGEKVIAVVNQLREAIRTGNVASAEGALAESVTIYEQGHMEASRTEYMGHHFKEDVAYAKVVPSKVVSVNAQVEGAMAVVMATSSSEGVYKDKPVKSSSVETYVLRQRDGVWQIVHIHWSSRKR